MRIIAGIHKGRRLHAPKGRELRPTSDRVREALFSIIGTRIMHAMVLDLYAGTGAVGLEALSRGAKHVAFVETHPSSLRMIRSNLALCGQAEQAAVLPRDATVFLQQWNKQVRYDPFDVVFADPPYHLVSPAELARQIAESQVVRSGGMLILEHAGKQKLPDRVGTLAQTRSYRYGDTMLTLFTNAMREAS